MDPFGFHMEPGRFRLVPRGVLPGGPVQYHMRTFEFNVEPYVRHTHTIGHHKNPYGITPDPFGLRTNLSGFYMGPIGVHVGPLVAPFETAMVPYGPA